MSSTLAPVADHAADAIFARCEVLIGNGYEPVPINGKEAKWEGWTQDPITIDRLRSVVASYPDHDGIGIRTGLLAVADVDLWEESDAAAVVAAIEGVCGESLVRRVGRKGVALCYFNASPIRKLTIKGLCPVEGRVKSLVELLGTGQQIAAYSVHPDTGRPYTWISADSGHEPLQMKATDLPHVTPAMLREAASAVAEVLELLGYDSVRVTGDLADRPAVEADDDRPRAPVSLEILRKMLSYIPADCDRITWIAVGGGIEDAPVEDEDFDPEGEYVAFSRGDYDPNGQPKNFKGEDDCHRTWKTIRSEGKGLAGFGTIVHHAIQGGYKGPISTLPSALEEHLHEVDAEIVEVEGVGDGPRFSVSDRTGQPSNTFPNALEAARFMGPVPEYDVFNHRVVFRGDVPWDARQLGRTLDDAIARCVRVYWLAKFGLDASKENVSEAIATVADGHRFHPVAEYLRSLNWDGIPRLNTWLTVYCGVDDSAYARAVARKTLVAAVARVLRPGIKFDTMLLLIGEQGVGKSTAFSTLAGKEWFSDSLPDDLSKPDAVAALQGKWIVEMSELESLSRSEVTTVKAFLSRQTDRARFAYERHTRDYPRQCVMVGTTNNSSALKDDTGARRFWPVTVGTVDVTGLRDARDQLWAEAMAAHATGEPLELPKPLWAEAAAQQAHSHEMDPWEDTLRDYLTTTASNRNRVHTSTLLTHALGIQKATQSKAHFTRLRTLMEKRLGWAYRKDVKVHTVNRPGYVRQDR